MPLAFSRFEVGVDPRRRLRQPARQEDSLYAELNGRPRERVGPTPPAVFDGDGLWLEGGVRDY